VTFVSRDDAAAYCTFYGKRLPYEWEWQWAAQGGDGRVYPWGNASDASRVPPYQDGGAISAILPAVGQYANGSSPFGVLDAVGLVWQWTTVHVTDHARDAPLRGGSFYRPTCR
jgi:gamma-glutamyl hercynylcysteine S-oxide synthase